MRNKKNGILFLFVIFCLIVAPFQKVSSQTPTTDVSVSPSDSATPTPLVPQEAPEAGINLTLSPPFINLSTDPGKAVTSSIRITNQNNFTEYLQMEVAKFTANPAGDAPVIADFTEQDEFRNWISFTEEQFTVAPNQTKTVRFSISPPENAALGYYYAVLVSRIDPSGAQQDTTGILKGSPAISVLLDVKTPNAKQELQLVEFKTDRMVYEYLPAIFQVKIKNTGNIHIVPSGDIFIDWGKDHDIGLVHANSTRGNILPQTTRMYEARWDDGFIVRHPKTEADKIVRDKDGKIVYTTTWDWSKVNKLRIGKYTAHLLMVYDNGQRDIPLEATVSFWVIPWKIIGVLLLILFFVIVGIKNTVFSQLGKMRKK